MSASVQESAADVVRRVHARSYRYPESFGGFRAEVAWDVDGAVGETLCSVAPGPRVELGEATPGSPWVCEELRSIMGHHQHVLRDRGAGNPTHGGQGAGHHRSPIVVELGDELDSSYGVRGDEIETLTRTMGERRFTIVVQERADTPDGTSLASRYTVFFWDAATGALAEVDCYHDRFVSVDELLLPASREVVRGTASGIVNRRLTLGNHELLGEVTT